MWRVLQLLDGEEEKREFNKCLIFLLLPTPGLTHNYSTFVQNVAEKENVEVSLLLKKVSRRFQLWSCRLYCRRRVVCYRRNDHWLGSI